MKKMIDTKWYLPEEAKKNIKWYKRKKVPQLYIDLMSGKKVKFRINLKDWKFAIGHINNQTKEEEMKNNKGEATLAVLLSMLIAGAVNTGALRMFSGGASGTASGGFQSAVLALTVYSQMPHVKRDFREGLASKIGVIEPKNLSDEQLLASVRDDGSKSFYADRWRDSLNIAKPTNGGKLRARILAAQ